MTAHFLRRVLAPAVLVFAMVLGVAPMARAGALEDGLKAYGKGDYAAARRLLVPLAEKGDPRAQTTVGAMNEDAQGGPHIYQEAERWYLKAANQAYAPAQYALGVLYANGHTGVARNVPEAIKWYRLAAEHGNAPAQTMLGLVYDGGLGVARNGVEAVKWYRLAAEQGDAGAQFQLGYKYEAGEGVDQSDRQAVIWYRKAAGQDEADAQNNLAFMYSNGRGVATDIVRAYMWYDLAARRTDAGEDPDAKANRDSVASKLTPAQIAQARDLAKACRASHFNRCD